MRNRITNPKKLRRLSERVGFPVVSALTRGGTDHRVDFVLGDGRRGSIWPGGPIMFKGAPGDQGSLLPDNIRAVIAAARKIDPVAQFSVLPDELIPVHPRITVTVSLGGGGYEESLSGNPAGRR